MSAGISEREIAFGKEPRLSSVSPDLILYLRVAGVYVASVLASGILPVWPVVQPMFKAEGVFAGACAQGHDHGSPSCDEQDMLLSEIYTIGASLLLVSSWPVGILFDVCGPRQTTSLGCVFCIVGSFALAYATRHPASCSWLLLPGVVLSDLGSTMNSFGLFGFLWHMHEQQGLLSGLASSTYSMSCLLPVAILGLLSFQSVLWLMVGLAVCALALCCILVPCSAEFASAAESVLGQKYAPQPFSLAATSRKCWSIFIAYYVDNMLFFISLLFMICNYQSYMAVLSPYLSALLDSDSASAQIVTAGTNIYGVVGFFLAPFAGRLADALGVKVLIYVMTILNVAMAVLTFAPSYDAQMFGNIVSTFLSLLQMTYYYRWFALYAPPNHFGSFQGALCSLCGLLALVFQSVVQGISDVAFSGLLAFLVPLGILSALNVASGLVFCSHILQIDLPAAPPCVDEGESLIEMLDEGI
eukprot:TRINITY_DN33501_c0_g1_i1.p1 TRINITY_DN33501_c0_g1~~TRINITY_DN33501_c0_g1_i1.p1  ORF type:complete len:483 (-),score=31.16 TRINITY_DN33501_c0_g1_i1:666-2078(-)